MDDTTRKFIKWVWWKGLAPFSVHFWKEVILNRLLHVSIIALVISLLFDGHISNFISDTKRDSVQKINDLESFELFRKEMIDLSISIDIVYELLNKKDKKIDKKYEKLKENIDNFYSSFDKNIRIIKKNSKKETIKKRECVNNKPIFASESVCNFKKIETSLEEVNRTLKSVYDSYKDDESTANNTLASHRQKIKKIQTDIILFLDKLNEN